MKNTQHISLFLLAMVVAMAVGCSDERSTEIVRSTLALYANHSADSRTSFNGSTSSWSDNDQLKAIVNGEAHTFGISNTTFGQFVSKEEVTASSKYDIYALYAASDANASIDATSKVATINIGAAEQTQNGTSPSHVALFDPLYGKVEGASEENLSLTMYHTAAALKVIVKNSTGATIEEIKGVRITVPDGKKIFGSHTVDLASNGVGSSISAATSGSNSITVTVDDSGSVANDDSFVVWAATAPFELASGEKLNIVVTADDKEYTFEKTIGESGASFTAGGIMQTTVELEATPQEPDPAPEDKPETIVVEFGDLEGGFVPEGLPAKTDNIRSGEYTFGDNNEYKISITSDVPYYKGTYEGKPYLIFHEMTNEQSLLISLPIIDGYVLKDFTLTTRSYAVSTFLKYGIVTSDLKLAGGIESFKIIRNKTSSVSLNGTDDNTQYFLYVYRHTSNNIDFYLNKVTLTYTLEE